MFSPESVWFLDARLSSRSARTCTPFSRTFLRKRIGIEHEPPASDELMILVVRRRLL
jgi:hypothetical protein